MVGRLSVENKEAYRQTSVVVKERETEAECVRHHHISTFIVHTLFHSFGRGMMSAAMTQQHSIQ